MMQRRSFLSLLIATPLVPALAKLSPQTLAAPERAALVERAFAAPRNYMRYVLSFGASPGFDHTIGAGRVGLLEALPQVVFRADRMMIQAPEDFEILSVSNLGEPQLDESLPAEVFSPVAFGTQLMFDAVAPGQRIVMAVVNHGKARTFNAAMMGLAVQ